MVSGGVFAVREKGLYHFNTVEPFQNHQGILRSQTPAVCQDFWLSFQLMTGLGKWHGILGVVDGFAVAL